jgi:serine/threonine-protein kinase
VEAPFAAPGDDPDDGPRYASIEEAVSALSHRQPDPSTLDFDGGIAPGAGRVPTGEFPVITQQEVQRAVEHAPPPLQEIEEQPTETGDFTAEPPLRVLHRLTGGTQLGLLVVTVGAIKKEIYVRDGIPEYVSSNAAAELFGNWLVQQGLLSHGELAMALAMMPHYSGKLGDTLVGLGLVKPLEVFRLMGRQVRGKLVDVCTWSKGSYAWYEGRTNPREAFPLDIDPVEVLGAGAVALPDGAVDGWLAHWRFRRARGLRGRFLPERFGLPGLRALFDSLDGRRTVGEVVAQWPEPADRPRVLRMLMLLDCCDMLRAM